VQKEADKVWIQRRKVESGKCTGDWREASQQIIPDGSWAQMCRCADVQMCRCSEMYRVYKVYTVKTTSV
jgi:hypothetical protein